MAVLPSLAPPCRLSCSPSHSREAVHNRRSGALRDPCRRPSLPANVPPRPRRQALHGLEPVRGTLLPPETTDPGIFLAQKSRAQHGPSGGDCVRG